MGKPSKAITICERFQDGYTFYWRSREFSQDKMNAYRMGFDEGRALGAFEITEQYAKLQQK